MPKRYFFPVSKNHNTPNPGAEQLVIRGWRQRDWERPSLSHKLGLINLRLMKVATLPRIKYLEYIFVWRAVAGEWYMNMYMDMDNRKKKEPSRAGWS